MNSYYYALWIPQYKEGIPDVKNQKLEETDLKDKPDDPPLLVSGEVNCDTLLISLKYKLGESAYRHIVFHNVVCADTGFIVYKLNLEDNENDFLCEGLRHSMPKAIYHYVKNFFHEHQFHSSDDDSLLEAYFSPTPIDLEKQEDLRSILKIYIQSYINKYAGCVFLCRDTLHRVTSNQRQDIKIEDSLTELHQVIENNKVILDGESLYCDFLINSYPGLIDSDQLQRIYGLRNELARYDERLQRQENAMSSSLSLKLARMGIVASVIGAVAGAGFSFVLSQCSSRELQESAAAIKSDIQRIESQDSLYKQDILFIKQQQDSILKLLNKPTPKK